jgi:hypothetical protein
MTINAGGQMKPRGGEVVAEKEVVAEEGKEVVVELKPSDYSCEILLEKTSTMISMVKTHYRRLTGGMVQ